MMHLGNNIRYLRKQKGLTQAELAEKLSVNRSLIGAYEEGRSEPRLATLQLLCSIFKVGLAQLIESPLDKSFKSDFLGSNLRILPVSVDAQGEELVTLIPQKAAAGYTKGYADADYIEQLKTANLPFPELQQSGTMRIFQIEGDSMLPVQPGAYIIGEFVENWHDLKSHQCYILLTLNDGIVYKRVENQVAQENCLRLISDNKEYQPYALPANEVLEVWRAKGVLSFDLPDQNTLHELHNQRLLQMMDEMRAELRKLSAKVDSRP
jgi:transcriptional regulator with XRE-family HTH domain